MQYNWEISDGDGNRGGKWKSQQEKAWQQMGPVAEDYNYPTSYQHGRPVNQAMEAYLRTRLC